MGRLRGREVFIIVGVVAVVLVAAWWFLLFSPLRQESATLDAEMTTAQSSLDTAQTSVAQLQQYQKAAPQTKADLVKLYKITPTEKAIPSGIVELSSTAKASGLSLLGFSPKAVVFTAPFTVQGIDLTFTGRYFDVVDFLYRLESYVQYRNLQFQVTGRLFAVEEITLGPGPAGYPDLAVSISVNGYLWTPSGAASTSGSATAGSAP